MKKEHLKYLSIPGSILLILSEPLHSEMLMSSYDKIMINTGLILLLIGLYFEFKK
jgi:hypothetical protein